MIGSLLSYMRARLDEHLRGAFGPSPEPISDKVVFVDGDKMDPLVFKSDAISLLAINVEEERVMRPADLYTRTGTDQVPTRIRPDIRLMLHLLFVARFKQYDAAWDHLTKVLTFFQANATIDAGAPGLPQGIEKLVFELQTLRFAEQNEVWNALRATHHPSLLYRVKLVALRDEAPTLPPRILPPIVIHAEQTTR